MVTNIFWRLGNIFKIRTVALQYVAGLVNNYKLTADFQYVPYSYFFVYAWIHNELLYFSRERQVGK